MINKFFIYLVFLCFSFPALATCFSAQEFKYIILRDHGENSKWIGISKIDSPTEKAIVLFENPVKKNWTMVIYHVNKKVMCVFAAGSFSQTFIFK